MLTLFHCAIFQILARILYTAAREGGYVDPHKVEQILKVREEVPTYTENFAVDESTEMSG